MSGQRGGKGRMGLWLLAFRNPVRRNPDGSFDLDAGVMLSVTPGSAWLLSVGIKGIGTIGIGWVTKWQREHDAAHEAGAEHTH